MITVQLVHRDGRCIAVHHMWWYSNIRTIIIVLACMSACICPMSFSLDIVASLILDDSSVKPNKSSGSNSTRNALHGKYA